MNEAVSDAIVGQLGADSFTIQRMGFTQTRTTSSASGTIRSSPWTMPSGPAIRRLDQLGDGAGATARSGYRDEELESIMVQGVSEDTSTSPPSTPNAGGSSARSKSAASGRWRCWDGKLPIGSSNRKIRSTNRSGSPASTSGSSGSAPRKGRRSATRSTSSWSFRGRLPEAVRIAAVAGAHGEAPVRRWWRRRKTRRASP